jgi:predicted phage-related endonuclease
MGESRNEMHRIEEVNRYTEVLYSPTDLREEAKIFPEEQQIIVKSGEYLGASEVNTIMNQKYRSIYNLSQEKVGIIPKKDVNNQFTRYGQEIEPYIINHIEKQGYIFDVEKRRCHDYKLSGIVDGIDKEKEVILEVKTYFNNPDLESYINQINVYFHIWNYKKAILAIYQKNDKFDSRNIETYNILRDNERIENILKSVEMFWNKCNILKLNPEMKKKEFDNLEV